MATDRPHEELTLVVDTPNGLYLRRIPDASPLVAGVERGPAVEAATRSAVARWGLPDFVHQPVVRQLGSGARELGDGILLVGREAVVVQVKSRAAAGDNPDREAAWIAKQTAKAMRQAQGTVRSLRSSPAEVANLRGRTITIDGTKYNRLAVIVVDHPDVPDNTMVDKASDDLPTVTLLRRDWEFLFDQLRSTHAVVQ
jgi:hypothetical protein